MENPNFAEKLNKETKEAQDKLEQGGREAREAHFKLQDEAYSGDNKLREEAEKELSSIGELPEPYESSEEYFGEKTLFTPTDFVKNVARGVVSNYIHNMSVDHTQEWDEGMHPKVDDLKVGETTVIESNRPEYLRVTRVTDTTFDVEYGDTDILSKK